jgi:hypothetical protein
VVFKLKMVYCKNMRSRLILLLVMLAGGAALELQAIPQNLKEDYQPIVTRNPFDLKPIEQPKPVEPPKAPEPVKAKQELYLTGIASIGYPKLPKKAFMVIREAGTNSYYSLREDESRDNLKLIKINDDVKPPTVRVSHNGQEMLLSFKTHALPSSAAAQPGKAAVAPGQLQPPGGSPPPLTPVNTQPVQQNWNGPMINGQPVGATHIPSRVNRAYNNGGFNNNAGDAANSVPYPTSNAGGGPPPLGSAGPGQSYGDPAQNQVDVADQYLRLKLQETRNKQMNVPTPPIPDLTR